MLQTVNLHSAHNSLKPLSQLNCREMRELPNPLNHLDYNESLESAGNKHEQYSGSGQKNVKHSFLKNQHIAGLQDDGKIHHEENHNVAVLHRNPELAYEKVVTHSYQVNRIAKRYADSQPSLRGEPLHNSLRVTQNSTSSRGPVTYKNFVGQRLCGTQRPAQHNPESSWQFTALRGVTLFTEIKTLALLWIRPPTVDQQRSAIFQGLSLAGFSTD